MQKILERTPMSKCDFNKVVLQLYWNRTSTWVFSCKFAAYFQNTFSLEHLWRSASVKSLKSWDKSSRFGAWAGSKNWICWYNHLLSFYFKLFTVVQFFVVFFLNNYIVDKRNCISLKFSGQKSFEILTSL